LPPLDGSHYDDLTEVPGLTCGASDCDALFITHYHSDHCGLLKNVNAGVPVYGSRETKSVLEVISDFVDLPAPKISVVEPGVSVSVGAMKILPIGVTHSARGAMMFLVESGGQKILYTGDFGDFNRVDYSPLLGADVMICEGTNVNALGYLTESDVEAEAARIMTETSNHVFVLCSATNADRVAAVESACIKSDRTMAIDPFMKAVTDQIAPLQNRRIVGFVPHYISKQRTPRIHKYLDEYMAAGCRNFIDAKEVARKTGLVMMVRPTMGEFVERLDKHRSVNGSVLIYSMWSGYKKTRLVGDFLALCDSLEIEIIDLHASGHAYRNEIETAIKRVSPKTLVPIHTESSREFKTMHRNVVLLKDGQEFELQHLTA
jgi:ribonuclease J